jgi:hypothetical protein
MQEIISYDFALHKIIVVDKSDLSRTEILNTANEDSGFPTEIYELNQNPDLKAIVFLSCNITNVQHYAIAICDGNSVSKYLLKSIEFNNYFHLKSK